MNAQTIVVTGIPTVQEPLKPGRPRRRRWLALVLTAAAIVSSLGWSAAPASAVTETADSYRLLHAGYYGTYHVRFYHSAQCLHIPGNAPWRGRWLVQWPCDFTSSSQSRQYWQVWVANNGVDFLLRSPLTGLCANIDHAEYGFGTPIILWDCYDPSGAPFPNEFFRAGYDPGTLPPNDYFWFVASQSTGWALNVDHASRSPGAHVILWNLQKQAANEWIQFA